TDARQRVPCRAVERHVKHGRIVALPVSRIPCRAGIDVEPVGVSVDEIAMIKQRQRRGIARRQAMGSADPQVLIVLGFEGWYSRSVTPARGVDDQLRMESEMQPRSGGFLSA